MNFNVFYHALQGFGFFFFCQIAEQIAEVV